MTQDQAYLDVIMSAIRVCANFKPKLGQGGTAGVTLEEFQHLYGADAFYHWFGLDSPQMYTAHRVSGGMTSIYRQIGIGCQLALNLILRDRLNLTKTEANWSFIVPTASGKAKKLSLDARIPIADVSAQRKPAIEKWLADATAALYKPRSAVQAGAVLEIRQGYKSRDSKRQNADIDNAAHAYANDYLPVVVVLSTQIDGDLVKRYSGAGWLILRGTLGGTALDSTYVFFQDVIGYDLAGFFARHAAALRAEIRAVLEKLLGTA